MMLFSLHSRFIAPAIMQPKNKYIEYLLNTTNCFSIVDFFEHFAFKNRLVANASFIEMIHVIWSQPQNDRRLICFSQDQIASQFSILRSEAATLYWTQEAQKSIDIINAEVEQKQQKLHALEALEKVSNLVKEKEEALLHVINKQTNVVHEDECYTEALETVEQEAEMTVISDLSTPAKEDLIEINETQTTIVVIPPPSPPSIPTIIDDLPMTSFLANLKPVLGSSSWIFDRRDMIKAWTIFKAKCAGQAIDRGISVANDVQSILALSHIFFIKSSDNSKSMNDYFQGPSTLYGIRKDMKSKIGLSPQYNFEGNAQSKVIETIENLLKKNTGKRKIAASEILNIAVNLPEDEYLILSELVSMINYLPRRPVTGEQYKSCITEYANTVLRPLFENVNEKKKLKWFNKESLQKEDEINAEVYSLVSNTISPLTIGKITPITGNERQDKLKASADLIQLAIDSKKKIDACFESTIRDVTFFHIVGFKVTVYVMSLLHEGLYGMMDVAEINIPQSIEDLIPFVTKLKEPLTASRAFKHCCSKENNDIICQNNFRPTLSTEKFDLLIGKSHL